MEVKVVPLPCLRTPVQTNNRECRECQEFKGDMVSLQEMNFCRVQWPMWLLAMEQRWLVKEKNTLRNMYVDIIQIHFLIHGYWKLFAKYLTKFIHLSSFVFFMFFHVCSFNLLEILLLSNFEAAVGFRETNAPVNKKKNEGFWKLKWNDAIVQKILINQSWMKYFCFFFQIDRFVSVSKLKYYFAVDTSYVVKKLGLLVFPFTHKVCRFLQLCLFNFFAKCIKL